MSHRAAIRESLAAVCDLIGQKKKTPGFVCFVMPPLHHLPLFSRWLFGIETEE